MHRQTTTYMLSRLPMNEVVKPYAAELLRVCVAALGSDNEENALIASRIAFDLHKSFRPALEEAVPDFLDFARKVTGMVLSVPACKELVMGR